jgi:uncharacterized membrane protein YbhN (UPF0104 family)
LLWFANYLWERRDLFVSIIDIPASTFLVLAVLVLFTWGFGALTSWIIYRAAGIAVGFWEMWQLNLASQVGKYLPISAGTAIRARYHKVLHGFGYARFSGVFGFRMVLTFVSTGLVGVTASLGVKLSDGRFSPILFASFLGMILLPLVAWWVRVPSTKRLEGQAQRIIRHLCEGLDGIRSQPRVVLLILLAMLARHAALALRFGVVAQIAGMELSVALLFLMAALSALAGIVSLTPGALGIREAVIGYAAAVGGLSFGAGMSIGTIDRVVLLLLVATVGLLGFLSVWRRVRGAMKP